MNAAAAALVWCAIQVTVLSCGVAVVYLAARRAHPRAGAVAAGGGLMMVIVLTAFAASPWPRWTMPFANNGLADGNAVERATSAASARDLPDARTQKLAATSAETAAPGPSFWRLLVDAVNRRRVFASVGDEALATPSLDRELGAERQAAWWPEAVVGVFLVGGLMAAVRLGWSIASVRRLARSGRPVEDSRLTAIVDEMRQRLEIIGPVVFRESTEMATPATVGWRRPVVLLPAAWNVWSEAELRAVVAHELAHIAGRDYAAWFVARLAVVAHFYHPLVRWLAARLQLEQELAADMAAARVVGDRKQYLHSLTALALALPAHRIAGPARTLFPRRSLLVRRVEMLRASGASRPRRGAARYGTLAMVGVVALAAAGLRGPGVDLAASAIAQKPPDAQTSPDDGAKSELAGPVERIGLEVVPPDAVFVVSVRPADLTSREELRALLESFGDVRRMLADATIGIADVAEVMAMQYGKLAQAPNSNSRIVVRFATAAHRTKFLDATTKEHRMVRLPDVEEGLPPLTPRRRRATVWEANTREQVTARITELDSLTLVIDEVVSGSTQASLKNDPVEWADVWKERKEQPVIFALDVRTAWQELAMNADPVQMIGEGAFQTLYPLITDVSWVVADVELKEQVRLGGVFQARDEKSAATVRETLQAAAVLLRNMARLYGKAQPQGPDGNPSPAAQFELQKRLAGEADDLLGSAKFETNGSRVAASFQPTLTTKELAELIKLVLPSIEKARDEARRSTSMYNVKQLGLAMLNYEAAKREFPRAVSTQYQAGSENRTSKYPHSWRIDVLPYLQQQALYDQYRFDEPWDSQANKKVLEQMPEVFQSPFDDRNSTNTSYFVFTGSDTVFAPGDKATRMQQITDGTSRTLMLVEAKRPVPWTKPEDIEYAADKPLPELGGWMPGEFLVGLADGSVKPMPMDLDEKAVRALITRAGGEVIPNSPPRGKQ